MDKELLIAKEPRQAIDILQSLVAVADINQIEQAMMQEKQVECSVIHRFGPGLYIREVHVPADTFAVGHRQKTEHMNVFLKGRVTVFNDNGTTSELVAPMIFVGNPGRKIGYVHEDMVWLNVYSTDETDVNTLEDMFIEKSMTWEEQAKIAKKSNLLAVNDDYQAVLSEFGFCHETAVAQSENTSDQTPFPHGSYKCKVGKSDIHGMGIFATASIVDGELIAPARIDGKRTPAGRYTNHSQFPNAEMRINARGDIDLVAIKCIKGCPGGMDGEEVTINYRQALRLQMEGK